MAARPTFRMAVKFWLKLGLLSFGGPAGQIALMHRELVEQKKWVEEARFLHALNFCMLLPGPEATQLATYCGWLLHGVRGGLVAGALFVLPGALAMWGLSWVYVSYGAVPAVAGGLNGLKAAVLAQMAKRRGPSDKISLAGQRRGPFQLDLDKTPSPAPLTAQARRQGAERP